MLRIVSLIASATEIVHALGLGSSQVGRSHECDFPESILTLPVCTTPRFPVEGSSLEIDQRVKQTLAQAASVYEVFREVLERLEPTHILTQSQCRVCAVSVEDVERALTAGLSTKPEVVALEPNCLQDLWSDIRRVAEACGVASRGDAVVEDLQARMQAIRQTARKSGARPRVACIEWQEPLMAAGNWVPELVETAAGQNLFGEAGAHSPWMSWEDLKASDPDVLILMPCGYGIEKTKAEMHWLENRPGWADLGAVRAGQVFVTDGNQYFNRPGPRLVESLQILGEILHPALFPPALEHRGWERRLTPVTS